MGTKSTMEQSRTSIASQGLCFFKHMFIKSLLDGLFTDALILQANVGVIAYAVQT